MDRWVDCRCNSVQPLLQLGSHYVMLVDGFS
ncbi:hypothetical protein X755_32710 [Mesorhizobium sp. LNJC405B00]|nr:hypothetical protein X755_32710 [Mesorhizobium sp. LNJC405B00]